MALTFTNWELTFTQIDIGTDTTTRTVEIRGADYDEASTNAIAFLASWQAASLLPIVNYRLGGVFSQDALSMPTSVEALVSNQAVITVDIADQPDKHATIVVPGAVPAVYVNTVGPNRDIVDPASTVVGNLVDEYKAAGTAFISDGETVDATSNIKGIRRTVYRRLA